MVLKSNTSFYKIDHIREYKFEVSLYVSKDQSVATVSSKNIYFLDEIGLNVPSTVFPHSIFNGIVHNIPWIHSGFRPPLFCNYPVNFYLSYFNKPLVGIW